MERFSRQRPFGKIIAWIQNRNEDNSSGSTETKSSKPGGSTTATKENNSASGQPAQTGTVQDYARQVANATGTSEKTWEYIINRESKGDSTILAYNVKNPKEPIMHGDLALAIKYARCYGIFQLNPAYFAMSGNDGSIAGQIATAIWLYNRQGFSAWSM
jgi:hypothetical protein